jgi:Ca-activated chloride channel family protein
MKYIILLFLFTFGQTALAQTVFSSTSHDFGELMEYSVRYVDIKITNKDAKQAYMLSVKKPFNVVYIVNGSFIQKDSSITVRLQVNPKEKGKFNYSVNIYTSDRNEPTKITLKGNLKEEPRGNTSSFQACPSFGQRPAGFDPTAFELTVVVIDKETKQPLPKTSVTLIQNGKPVGTFKTNKNGKIIETVPLGYTYFYSTNDDYETGELGGYVNFQRNYVVLELTQKEREIVLVPDPDLIVVNEKPKAEPREEVKAERQEIIIDLEEDLTNRLEKEKPSVKVPLALASLDPNDFSQSLFKPVNVSFVLDVSSSMRSGDKIELMKFALYELAGTLRPEDKISLVTYADNARVILPPTTGDEKEPVNDQVAKLKASGMTAGGEGIKLGYKANLKGFIPDGINHVIVITDGAFNRNSKDYKKYVRKYKKKGITLSIVGIKNSEKDAIEMQEAAELGGGRYIPIFKLVDAQNNLKQEIRLISYRF